MVKQSPGGEEFEQFATSLFRLTRSLRAASHLWLQLPGGLKSTDITILFVTHEMGFARDFSHRVMMFDGGKVIEDAPPEQLFTSPDHRRTKDFLQAVLNH